MDTISDITMMDVSLRDGGHRTNFYFSTAELEGILKPLDNSRIEYIEIGYRNGSLHPIENLGPAGFCHREYLTLCQSLIVSAKIAVMVHPQNVTAADILELKECGVMLIRICVAKGALEQALPLIDMIKSLGLEVSVNIIHMSYYTMDELDEVLEKISSYQPDMVYFADSNGSMFPSKIKKIYEKYTKNHAFCFGFHAHDNLGLAQANALAALDSGARCIDASLAGMGKGTGNLKTEFFVAFLHAMGVVKYHFTDVLLAANFVRKYLKIGQEPLEPDEFTRGISDFSTADLKVYKS